MNKEDLVLYKLPEDLEYWTCEECYITHKIINENRVIFVIEANPSLWQVCLACRFSLGCFDETFQYKDKTKAVKAMDAWIDLNAEPDGWFRHIQSGRRREYFLDGTFREWVQL